ncbi:hypothetical protein HDU97_006599 [Phlyctochytrium planicorne]|nr:hypothetical protein HDU97_006599 [Phlyctochytrium planicorne]
MASSTPSSSYVTIPKAKPSSFPGLTQVLPDDCPILDNPLDPSGNKLGTCFRKNADGMDYMRQRCDQNRKCAGWACKENPADGCWLIGSGFVTLQDASDQNVWLKAGQAVTMNGTLTRAGMPGSTVTNLDCAAINSMADWVDPVKCCKHTDGAYNKGAARIYCQELHPNKEGVA